ncbi:MAG: hypothetical protein A2V88_03490 [Elusimicrobia bacterium RBG_16_66_12]|nr:MAG: hypothetical protein A2V88_03490 [Elusimicrobia bacterium RBG_16_66_12]
MEILTRRVSAFFGLSVLLLWPGLRANALPAGAIQMIPNGAVEVRRGRDWRPASGTETLFAGSEVRTSASSTAELRFSDGSRVLLTPGTLFKIDQTDARETSFSLGLGKIRAAFAGLLSSRVRIRTPTAVAAVRGTVFEMGTDGKESAITMAEGVLEVTDNKGKEAVLTSEETLRIGENGMEKPQLVPLHSPEALQAVRPYAVHQETARDATRAMLEDLRNRELKANEAQLGKDVVDAFGRRVRLEEYLLRPDTKSFEVLFLSHRQSRFDWGYFKQTFNSAIPNDLSQVPAIVAGGFLAKNQPSNWLKSFEFYATNTVDALKEVMTLGDPVRIDFAGYNGGVQKLLWYPSSIDYTQTLIGPGVPGGSRDQFQQHQDYNLLNPSLFTWTQRVQPTAGVNTPIGDASTLMVAVVLDPASVNPADPKSVPNGGDAVVNAALYNNTNTAGSLPSGPTKADLRQITTYPDGSTVDVEKFLVSNDGKILDFSDPNSGIFNKEGTYNLEINIKSSLFQGRDIDVMIAPEILRQKNQQATTADNLKP